MEYYLEYYAALCVEFIFSIIFQTYPGARAWTGVFGALGTLGRAQVFPLQVRIDLFCPFD